LFGFTLWPEISDYMEFARKNNAEEIRNSPEFAYLYALLARNTRDLDVVNIKIYDLNGRTIFSAAHAQVGEEQHENPGVIGALQGEVVTSLTYKHQLNQFDRVTENRDVLGSYVPLYRPNTSEIVGVLELYTDATPVVQYINLITGRVLLGGFALLTVLYVALLALVRYAERILHTQYAERIAAESALRRRNEYLYTLHNVTLAVMNRADSQRVLADILHAAMSQYDAQYGMIASLAADQRSMTVQVAVGGSRATTISVDLETPYHLPSTVSVTPLDAASPWSQTWLAPLHTEETKTVIETLLEVGDRTVGILALASSQPGETFGKEERELIHHFARLASLAFDNTQLYATLQDELSERWRIEESLSLSERRFHTLIQSMVDTVFTMDHQGHYTGIYGRSTEAQELIDRDIVGLSADEVWPEHVAEMHHTSSKLALQGNNVVYEWSLPQADSSGEIHLQTSLSPIRDAQSAITGLVGVTRNVTGLKQAELAKADFVANVSHELRTPLASILGYTEILLQGRPGYLTPIQQEFLGTVLESGMRLKALVDDLLDVSQLDAGHFRLNFDEVALPAVVQKSIDIISPVADKSAVSVQFERPDSLPSIEGDRQRLGQVLDNLLSNAVKFTNPGGSVTVSLIEEAAHVCIEIHDTGIGMDEADIATLFQRFHRGRYAHAKQSSGTGLGLYIAKAIVEGHHGNIQVDSTRHVGTTVRVQLPFVQPSDPEIFSDDLVEEISREYYGANKIY
jgi:PAS domain S-box-containing protein